MQAERDASAADVAALRSRVVEMRSEATKQAALIAATDAECAASASPASSFLLRRDPL